MPHWAASAGGTERCSQLSTFCGSRGLWGGLGVVCGAIGARGQAIDYVTENTALSLLNIGSEVNRYIAWPGQSVAYDYAMAVGEEWS